MKYVTEMISFRGDNTWNKMYNDEKNFITISMKYDKIKMK